MNRRSLLKTLALGGAGALLLGAETMTTPLQHGYPDWGRQRAASDILVLNVNNVAIPGNRVDGPLFVGTQPYLYAHALCANQAEITLDWFADAAATIALERDQLVTGIGGDVTQCVPVAGPYLRITTNTSVNPSTTTLRFYMTSSPFAHFATTGGLNTLISVDNAVIGGFGVATTNATAARGGWVYWNASIYDRTPIFARLFAVQFSGVATLLDFNYHPVNATGKMVLAPALPLRITVQEQTGVGSTYSAVAIHHPFYP